MTTPNNPNPKRKTLVERAIAAYRLARFADLVVDAARAAIKHGPRLVEKLTELIESIQDLGG